MHISDSENLASHLLITSYLQRMEAMACYPTETKRDNQPAALLATRCSMVRFEVLEDGGFFTHASRLLVFSRRGECYSTWMVAHNFLHLSAT